MGRVAIHRVSGSSVETGLCEAVELLHTHPTHGLGVLLSGRAHLLGLASQAGQESQTHPIAAEMILRTATHVYAPAEAKPNARIEPEVWTDQNGGEGVPSHQPAIRRRVRRDVKSTAAGHRPRSSDQSSRYARPAGPALVNYLPGPSSPRGDMPGSRRASTFLAVWAQRMQLVITH